MPGSGARRGLLIVAMTLLAGPAVAFAAEPPTSAPTDGVSFTLEAARTEVYPQEGVQLYAVIRGAPDRPVVLPIWSGNVGALHVKTPDGSHFVIDRGPASGKQWITWRARRRPSSMVCFRYEVEFTRSPSPRLWRKPDGKAVKDGISFQAPGKYEFWYELSARKGWQSAAKGKVPETATLWSGPVVTRPLVVTVHKLTREAIRDKPTPEQLKDLQTVSEGEARHGQYEVRLAMRRLRQAILLAPNDGLAVTMVAMLREDREKNGSLHRLLRERAMRGRRELRFKGEYLRGLVELELDWLGQWYKLKPPKPPAWPTQPPAWGGLIVAYLRKHDAPELRKAAIELGFQHARLPAIPQDAGVGFHRYQHARLGISWAILAGLDALKGKSVEQLRAILGEPTSLRDDYAHWYYSSMMHVNPGLRVELKDGKAVAATAH